MNSVEVLDPLIVDDARARAREFIGRPRSRCVVPIAGRLVGAGQPVFVIAEIGINHNGSLELAKRLIEGAWAAGVDAVKFQKREVEICVPRDQWDRQRETPWGRMTYIDYKRRIEFGQAEFDEIDRFSHRLGIPWLASCWDIPSVEFMERYSPVCHKIASACITDLALLHAVRWTGRPTILSTGMSTLEEIDSAVDALGRQRLLIAHATSTYPCPPSELNLSVLSEFSRMYPGCPIGYSGHEQGLCPTIAAVALGATFVERHITLDRTAWGTDHSASLELAELAELVRGIREVERALGDGKKRVYDSEIPVRSKLRRVL
ncbi:MAG: N-acetylneuraminate synthase family protein [Myxococcales bacterium]|nr:N-acetylneuraminate synthase family protein [Myxococcales bacterium]